MILRTENPNCNPMSFSEAAKQAKFEVDWKATLKADTTIIRLMRHPDGLWTVQYRTLQRNRDNSSFDEVIYERPLNLKDE